MQTVNHYFGHIGIFGMHLLGFLVHILDNNSPKARNWRSWHDGALPRSTFKERGFQKSRKVARVRWLIVMSWNYHLNETLLCADRIKSKTRGVKGVHVNFLCDGQNGWLNSGNFKTPITLTTVSLRRCGWALKDYLCCWTSWTRWKNWTVWQPWSTNLKHKNTNFFSVSQYQEG